MSVTRFHAALILIGFAALIVAVAWIAVPYRDYAKLYHKLFSPPDTSPALYKILVLQQAWRSEQIDGAVVFLGDSLTAGLATSRITPNSENFGIPGDTLDSLLQRVPLYDLHRASAIVLEVGINDWDKNRFVDFGIRYRKLMAQLPPQTPIIVTAIFPVNSRISASTDFNGLQVGIARANRAIATECRKLARCRLIDVSAKLADADGALKFENEEGDGIHLSTRGYAVWREALIPALATSLERR